MVSGFRFLPHGDRAGPSGVGYTALSSCVRTEEPCRRFWWRTTTGTCARSSCSSWSSGLRGRRRRGRGERPGAGPQPASRPGGPRRDDAADDRSGRLPGTARRTRDREHPGHSRGSRRAWSPSPRGSAATPRALPEGCAVRALRCSSTRARNRFRMRPASAGSVMESDRNNAPAGERVDPRVDDDLERVAALTNLAPQPLSRAALGHATSMLAIIDPNPPRTPPDRTR